MIKDVRALIAMILLRTASSFAEINGSEVYVEGNNPHSWSGENLTNIVKNATNIPGDQKPLIESNNTFRVVCNFTGISDITNYVVSFSNTNGNWYGGTNFIENAPWTMIDFEVGKEGPSNNVPLEGPMIAVAIDDRNIYALNPNMDYVATGNSNYTFTCSDLGEVIGVIDNGIDSDNDNATDDREVYVMNTETNNPDTDGDLMLDGDEDAMGFDPNLKSSVFRIDDISGSSISWPGKSNVTYTVQVGNDLNSLTNVEERIVNEDRTQTYDGNSSDDMYFIRITADISGLF